MEQVCKYEEIKVNNSSGITKTLYQNGIYLLLLGKRILKKFEIHVNKSSYSEISASLF